MEPDFSSLTYGFLHSSMVLQNKGYSQGRSSAWASVSLGVSKALSPLGLCCGSPSVIAKMGLGVIIFDLKAQSKDE